MVAQVLMGKGNIDIQRMKPVDRRHGTYEGVDRLLEVTVESLDSDNQFRLIPLLRCELHSLARMRKPENTHNNPWRMTRGVPSSSCARDGEHRMQGQPELRSS